MVTLFPKSPSKVEYKATEQENNNLKSWLAWYESKTNGGVPVFVTTDLGRRMQFVNGELQEYLINVDNNNINCTTGYYWNGIGWVEQFAEKLSTMVPQNQPMQPVFISEEKKIVNGSEIRERLYSNGYKEVYVNGVKVLLR